MYHFVLGAALELVFVITKVEISISLANYSECSLFTICFDTSPPFMCQCLGLPHRLAQCMRPQGWGKLLNAALLSLINKACVNVFCATLLSSELVGPACVQARLSNPRGRASRPSGKGSGRRGY